MATIQRIAWLLLVKMVDYFEYVIISLVWLVSELLIELWMIDKSKDI